MKPSQARFWDFEPGGLELWTSACLPRALHSVACLPVCLCLYGACANACAWRMMTKKKSPREQIFIFEGRRSKGASLVFQ